MEPIDKIIVRTIILILGSIFGYTAVKVADSHEQIAQLVRNKTIQHAGFGPALPEKK